MTTRRGFKKTGHAANYAAFEQMTALLDAELEVETHFPTRAELRAEIQRQSDLIRDSKTKMQVDASHPQRTTRDYQYLRALTATRSSVKLTSVRDSKRTEDMILPTTTPSNGTAALVRLENKLIQELDETEDQRCERLEAEHWVHERESKYRSTFTEPRGKDGKTLAEDYNEWADGQRHKNTWQWRATGANMLERIEEITEQSYALLSNPNEDDERKGGDVWMRHIHLGRSRSVSVREKSNAKRSEDSGANSVLKVLMWLDERKLDIFNLTERQERDLVTHVGNAIRNEMEDADKDPQMKSGGSSDTAWIADSNNMFKARASDFDNRDRYAEVDDLDTQSEGTMSDIETDSERAISEANVTSDEEDTLLARVNSSQRYHLELFKQYASKDDYLLLSALYEGSVTHAGDGTDEHSQSKKHIGRNVYDGRKDSWREEVAREHGFPSGAAMKQRIRRVVNELVQAEVIIEEQSQTIMKSVSP